MKPVIILAGGLGTRLRSVVGEIPKPLAPVAGKPFLWWLLRDMEAQGVRDVCLSVGYKAELVQDAFGVAFGGLRLSYSVEAEPLGTGGAVLRAARSMGVDEFFVLNGDTLAVVNLNRMEKAASASRADAAVAVAQVLDASRYGTIEIGPGSRVIGYLARGQGVAAHISAGVYLLRTELMERFGLPEKFSIEHDFFESHLEQLNILAFAEVGDFLDIGIPEDYQLAQTKIPFLATHSDPRTFS